MAGRKWTPDEIAYLYKHFPDTPTKELAEHLGRGYSGVAVKANQLGLKKTASYISENCQRFGKKGADAGKVHRFKKGMTPWNKGKKFYAGGNSVRTQFQPGSLPHNTKEDGYISQRKYGRGKTEPWVRIELKKWKPLRLQIWEDANGPVPDGKIIVYKDGNPQNCQLDNLECITRAENLRRNTIHRYPQEIKDSIRLINKLQKEISDAEE